MPKTNDMVPDQTDMEKSNLGQYVVQAKIAPQTTSTDEIFSCVKALLFSLVNNNSHMLWMINKSRYRH